MYLKLSLCLMLFENSVLRRISDHKRHEVRDEWRKLHNEELNDPYSPSSIVRVIKSWRIRWAGHVARIGERRVVYRVLVGKSEGKKPLGRSRHRWKNNIKWIFKRWDVWEWTGSSWLRIWTCGGHMWMRWWNFGLHKIWGISLLAENQLASRGLWSLE